MPRLRLILPFLVPVVAGLGYGLSTTPDPSWLGAAVGGFLACGLALPALRDSARSIPSTSDEARRIVRSNVVRALLLALTVVATVGGLLGLIVDPTHTVAWASATAVAFVAALGCTWFLFQNAPAPVDFVDAAFSGNGVDAESTSAFDHLTFNSARSSVSPGTKRFCPSSSDVVPTPSTSRTSEPLTTLWPQENETRTWLVWPESNDERPTRSLPAATDDELDVDFSWDALWNGIDAGADGSRSDTGTWPTNDDSPGSPRGDGWSDA